MAETGMTASAPAPDTTPDPVFVLAPPRGQGAWLAAALGCHPDLMALPATHLFVGETWATLQRSWTGPRARLLDGLARAHAWLIAPEENEATITAARAWLNERRDLPVAALFDALRALAAPRGLVDGSYLYPMEPEALSRIADACPRARYIHLVRHPLDHLLDTGLTDPDPRRQWLAGHLAVLEFLHDRPAGCWIRVRAEMVWADPARYLGQLAEWLGLPCDDSTATAMTRTDRAPHAGPGPVTAPTGDDPAFLRSPALPSGAPRVAARVAMDEPLAAPLGEDVRHYARLFGYT